MWMLEVDLIPFENYDGNSYNIKDMKDIPVYNNTKDLQINNENLLDEICSRNDVYGPGSEDFSYKLFEANIVAITENNFSLNNLKSLKVPIE